MTNSNTITKYDGYTELKGKIAEEILDLKDAKGNYYFAAVNKDMKTFFIRNIINLPWANHIALNLIVSEARNLSPKTQSNEITTLSPRLKNIFSHFQLNDMNELEPDVHLYAYLKGKIFEDHSVNQRAEFLKSYQTAEYRVRKWLLSKVSPEMYSVLNKFILLKPTFDSKDFRILKEATDNAKQVRKLETSAITPLLPQIRAEGHLRRNQLVRLRDKCREVLKAVKDSNWSLPVEFDYVESDTVGEHFYFKLWDKPSFVLAHQEKYSESSIKAATNKMGAYSDAKNEYFVEFIKSECKEDGTEGEGLWFLELIKEDVLGNWFQNKSEEEIQKRLFFLNQWGYGDKDNIEIYPIPFPSQHKGILGQSKFIAEAQDKAEGMIFNVEPFYVATTFSLFALNLFTSSGVRLNELLQVAHNKECLVVSEDTTHNPPRKNFIFRLIPKGRDEPENYYVPEDIFKFLREILHLLKEHYSLGKLDPIPSVSFDYQNRKHMFGNNRYLFQYNGRHLGHKIIQATLKFLLHGIVIQTDEGGQVSVKPHLLRHAFATHAVQTEKLPIDVVKELLHQKDIQVTGYYSQPTQGQIGQAVNDLHDNWVSHIDIQQGILRGPDELQQYYDEYSEKVGTLSKVTGGICTTDSVCPVKMACIGCAAKVPRPEFKDEIEDYLKWASDSEEYFRKKNQPLEIQKMKLAKNRARTELKEIQLIENYQKDAKYDPVVRINRP